LVSSQDLFLLTASTAPKAQSDIGCSISVAVPVLNARKEAGAQDNISAFCRRPVLKSEQSSRACPDS
jgi:hypothetical protein